MIVLAMMAQMTAADLMTICKGTDAEAQGFCKAFIYGVQQGIMIGTGMTDAQKKSYCMPDDVSTDEVVPIVKRKAEGDLRVFPQDASNPASSMVAAILIDTYPCRAR
jgi:hypothetical protein